MSLTSEYRTKRVVFEIRHLPNLLFVDHARHDYNGLVPKSDTIHIDPAESTFELLNQSEFWGVQSQNNRLLVNIENSTDVDHAVERTWAIVKAFRKSILHQGIITKRLSSRMTLLFPYEGDFSQLLSFIIGQTYKNPDAFSKLGEVLDFGMNAIAFKIGSDKVSLSYGPFSNLEINEFSSFANFEDGIESALMVDIDLSRNLMVPVTPEMVHRFIIDALQQSRLLALEFFNNFMAVSNDKHR